MSTIRPTNPTLSLLITCNGLTHALPIKRIALGLIRFVVASKLVVSSLGAQPIATSRDPGREILERALHAERDSPSTVPVSIAISFLPSCHPESKLLIRFKSPTEAEVESIQASVASGEALTKVRHVNSADVADAVALMRVRRNRFEVDRKVASGWLQEFQTAVSASLDAMNKKAFDHMAQLDGTLYELRYRGDAELSIRVAGCEVGSDCTHDLPIVQWMDKMRKIVGAMADKRGK